MSGRSNQEIEKDYFEQFAKNFPLPNGEIQYGDKPDVIILDSKKIGIEIANLYLIDGADETSEQVQLKRREKVIQLAEADYKSKRNLNFEFHISFNSSIPIINTKSTATKLVEFIISVENNPRIFFTSNAFNFSPEIYSVHRSQKENPNAKWKITQVFDGENLQVVRVKEIVQKKNKLISGYECCDSYWLLLVVDTVDSAQDQEIEWPVCEPPIESKFEKVIIYRTAFRQYTEIPISRF